MAAAAGINLFTSRDIAGFEVFSGRTEEFDAWIVGFEAECQNRGLGNWVGHVRGHVDDDYGNVAGLGPVATEISASLFALFARRLRGKALTFVQLAERGHGFVVLASLYREYKPRGLEPDHGILSAVINPTWWRTAPHKDREFADVLLDWDRLVAQYEIQSGEAISNAVRCATVLAWCPKATEQLLRSGPREVRNDHRRMRECIRDAQLGHNRSYVPTYNRDGGGDDMQVDAILSGKGVKG